MDWVRLIVEGFALAAYPAFLVLLLRGGNDVCKWAVRLADTRKAKGSGAAGDWLQGPSGSAALMPDDAQLQAGRLIGNLERSLIALGIITAHWEVMAAVIALKTLARYKELEKQVQAEYFLIGSLASLLWAAFVTGLWLAFDGLVGFDLFASIRMMPGVSPS